MNKTHNVATNAPARIAPSVFENSLILVERTSWNAGKKGDTLAARASSDKVLRRSCEASSFPMASPRPFTYPAQADGCLARPVDNRSP